MSTETRQGEREWVVMRCLGSFQADGREPALIWHALGTLRGPWAVADALAEQLYGEDAVPLERTLVTEAHYQAALDREFQAEHAARVAAQEDRISRFVQRVRAAILRRNNGHE